MLTGYQKPQPKPRERLYPYLRVYGTVPGELLVSFPDIAPIGALLAAVEKQIAQGENSVLDEIHAQLASQD